jgi:hypothetical protein
MSTLIEVKISWGQLFSPETKTYEFETEEQKAFFLKGVEEGWRWLEYEILRVNITCCGGSWRTTHAAGQSYVKILSRNFLKARAASYKHQASSCKQQAG